MSGFNRRVWRAKPPMGTPLASGLYAPNRLAVPFNEISVTGGWRNYAMHPTLARIDGVGANSPTIAQGLNGPVASFGGATQVINFTIGVADLIPTSQATFLIGYKKRDATARAATAFGKNAGGATRCNVYLPFSDGVLYFDWGGTSAGTSRLSISGLTFGGYEIWGFSTGPRGMEIWRNASLIASNSGNTTRTADTATFVLGSDGANGSDLVDWDFIYCWDTQLPQPVIQQLSALPFSVFEQHHTRIFPQAQLPSITGDAAITEDADTISAAGTVAVAGAAAITESADTLAAAGTAPITGSAGITEGDDTLVAYLPLEPRTGDAAITEDDDTLAADAQHTRIGDAAITEGADTLLARFDPLGEASITEGDDSLVGAGSAPITGNAAIDEGSPDTVSAIATTSSTQPTPDSFRPGATSGQPGIFKGATETGTPGGFRPVTQTETPGIFKPKA